ncbi:hypothetical protein ElyMa_001515700 [Elysia marginata]|uniref:ABC transmembrane type-1 domain-containing protein n=1 Tax=Elysia marginata TaxID=1093978 RepID=A0AAV4J7E4_9GAST|nr:hypothetical protein ElyMa_001515700 [Elysia marginata]
MVEAAEAAMKRKRWRSMASKFLTEAEPRLGLKALRYAVSIPIFVKKQKDKLIRLCIIVTLLLLGVSSGAIGRAVDRSLRGPGFDPQTGLNFICSPVPTQHWMGS